MMPDVPRLDANALSQRLRQAGPEGLDLGGQTICPEVFRNAIGLMASEIKSFSDVRIKNAKIKGKLHLDNVNLPGYLRFDSVEFGDRSGGAGGVDLRHARLRRLMFSRCRFWAPLEADTIFVEGDVNLRRCELWKGASFASARVGGRFVVEGCKIHKLQSVYEPDRFSEGNAFDGARLRVGSGLQFREYLVARRVRNPKICQTYVLGTVDLQYAEIGGSLEFQNSTVGCRCDDKPSVDASSATVKGFTFFRGSNGQAGDFMGPVVLFSGNLKLLSFTHVALHGGLDAESVSVETNLTIGEGTKSPSILLRSAKIGGVFQFGGEESEAGEFTSFDKSTINIVGELNLAHSNIGRMQIEEKSWSANFSDSKKSRAIFRDCRYASIMMKNGDTSSEDGAYLKFSKSIWPEGVECSGDYTFSSYKRLSDVVHKEGSKDLAKKIYKFHFDRECRVRYGLAWFVPYLFLHVLDFGFSARRLILYTFLAWLLPACAYYVGFYLSVFDMADSTAYSAVRAGYPAGGTAYPAPKGSIGRMPPEYTGFLPLLYSLDVLLPVVDLGQAENWAPTSSQWVGCIFWFVVACQSVLGWVFSALAFAYVAAFMRQDQ